jgi:hypothetical protein
MNPNVFRRIVAANQIKMHYGHNNLLREVVANVKKIRLAVKWKVKVYTIARWQ